MKLTFTLVFSMFAFALIAQDKLTGIKLTTPSDQDTVKIRMRCSTVVDSRPPLFLIDGIVSKEKDLKAINPNDIEHIEILKASAVASFCNMPPNGIIVITTKKSRLKQFSISDALGGKPVASATVTFIPEKKPADSIMLMADVNGAISTNKLTLNAQYRVRISSIGFEPYSAVYVNDKNAQKQFSLTREFAECAPVIIIAYGFVKRRDVMCCGCSYRFQSGEDSLPSSKNLSVKLANFRQYPNPVTAGNQIKLQWNNQALSQIQARIVSLDGRVLLSKNYPLLKGSNLLTVSTENRWTPGMYFVQLNDESGRLIKQEKLLIQ